MLGLVMSLKEHIFSIEFLCCICVIQFRSLDEAYQYVWFVLMLHFLYPLWGIIFCKDK